jgi:type III secretion system FlhB-like substrate exporter
VVKTILKLVVLLLVINAIARAANAAWHYYEFKDEAQQIATFGGGHSETELHNQILKKAEELEVPVQPEELIVHRDGNETIVEVAYTHPVELVPRYYTYPAKLRFTVNAFVVKPTTADGIR